MTLVAVLAMAVAAGAAEPGPGTRLYAERCTACHGADGRGDGPVAAGLQPPPRNFRDATFWSARSLDDIRAVIREGRPGTLMPPFAGVFSDEEIDAVARHLTSFRPVTGDDDATRGDGEASGGGPREDASRGRDRP